jgi:hypothetical protein
MVWMSAMTSGVDDEVAFDEDDGTDNGRVVDAGARLDRRFGAACFFARDDASTFGFRFRACFSFFSIFLSSLSFSFSFALYSSSCSSISRTCSGSNNCIAFHRRALFLPSFCTRRSSFSSHSASL